MDQYGYPQISLSHIKVHSAISSKLSPQTFPSWPQENLTLTQKSWAMSSNKAFVFFSVAKPIDGKQEKIKIRHKFFIVKI